MKQLRSCKKGHFVKYKGKVYQVNCFFTNHYGSKKGKLCTLVPIHKKGETVRLEFIPVTTKVEYIGEKATIKGITYITRYL